MIVRLTAAKKDIVHVDMLTQGLLLVVVPREPAEIGLKTPRESLSYGYDSEGLRPCITPSGQCQQSTTLPSTNPLK